MSDNDDIILSDGLLSQISRNIEFTDAKLTDLPTMSEVGCLSYGNDLTVQGTSTIAWPVRDFKISVSEDFAVKSSLSPKESAEFNIKCIKTSLASLAKLIDDNKLNNEQFYLDFLDELNKYSVRD